MKTLLQFGIIEKRDVVLINGTLATKLKFSVDDYKITVIDGFVKNAVDRSAQIVTYGLLIIVIIAITVGIVGINYINKN